MIPDISKHFQKYQSRINDDFLEGVGNYSKTLPTKDPTRYPSAYHYISNVLAEVKQAVHTKNIRAYIAYMELHQKAIIALFENYVSSFLKEYIDLWGVDKRLCMDFITEKGVHWYKFSGHPFRYSNNILVVPRHNEFQHEDAMVVVDADEIRLLLRREHDLGSAIEAKSKYSCNYGEKIVSFQDNEVSILRLTEINTGGDIHDWSSPLFKD